MSEDKLDFNLQFTQQIIQQSKGEYKRLKDMVQGHENDRISTISKKANESIIKSIIHQSQYAIDSWVYSSGLYLQSDFGQAYFQLQFYYDRRVIITSFSPSNGTQLIYNPDIRCLARFCDVNGWLQPEPIQIIIQEQFDMWKYFWETNIVQSSYLERKLGKKE